jgi:hypothetical protein
MDDKTRMQAELKDAQEKAKDAERLRAENGQFTSAFENLYNSELATLPEDKREAVERLSKSGSWADRVDALRNAKVLIGSLPAPPAVAGTITQPGGGTPPPTTPEAPKPRTPDEIKRTGLGNLISERRASRTT